MLIVNSGGDEMHYRPPTTNSGGTRPPRPPVVYAPVTKAQYVYVFDTRLTLTNY